jgi:hypothetical protein
MTLRPERYDEMRRAWIAAHQGWSTIQRRRAELLGRKIRARQRAVASAVPDPHDDTVIPPLWLRTTHSPASQVELMWVVVCAVIAPLGWPAGYLLKSIVARLIPNTLRAFPIAALLWAGAVLGALILLLAIVMHDPSPTFGQAVLTPWICLQMAAVPAAAGVYGVAEGWLAIPGSTQWWPLTPPKRPITAEDAAEVLGGYDITGPGLLDAKRLNDPGERTR